MAAQTVNYKCPSCDGALRFDPNTGRLECDFCGSSFSVKEIERIYEKKQEAADRQAEADQDSEHAKAQSVARSQKAFDDAQDKQHSQKSTSGKQKASSDPIEQYLKHATWLDEQDHNLQAYNCSSCGAQLMVDKSTAVTTCPYCGNNVVIGGRLSGMLKPDYVIAFAVDKKAALRALEKYYQGKLLLPKSFSACNHLEQLQGIYVPFWLYSTSTTADAFYRCRNTSMWSDSRNNYIKTDTFRVHRKATVEFHRVPVDASTMMPDAHMDAIEPFDYSKLEPFSVAYLPGFLCERYDQDAQECQKRARSRMQTTAEQLLRTTVTGYSEVEQESLSIDIDWHDISYALLPVWMLHTTYNGKDYLFAMNAQTGKLIGDLPIDIKREVGWFALWFVIAAIVFAVIFFVVS